VNELLAALKAKYAAMDGGAFDALRAANTGGLYLAPHLQEQAYPYMTLIYVSSRPVDHMGGEIDIATIQFSIFSDTLSEIMTIYGLARAAWDQCSLTYASDTHIIMLRSSETGPEYIEDAWQVTIDYAVWRT